MRRYFFVRSHHQHRFVSASLPKNRQPLFYLSRFDAFSPCRCGQRHFSAITNAYLVGESPIRTESDISSSQSESKQTQSGSTAVGSTLQAGNDITLSATGDGSNSHLNVTGSDIAAGNNVALKSDGDINLQAAQSTFEQHSTNKSSSAAVGVAVSFGSNGAAFGVTASASAGRGHADGEDITQSNTHITAGNLLTIDSQGDTNMKGAVASGQQVIAKVGGNLNIESLQDTSTYHSKDENIGGSVTVGFGFSGSASYSNSKVDGDFASVTEQSGIKAGDGGYQVNVTGNTDLKGGAIASSQAAIDQNKNSLTTGTLTVSDIQNRANYSASSVSVGGGVSFGGGDSKGKSDGSTADSSGAHWQNINTGKTASAGYGSDSGSDSSVTKSGISGGTLVITNDKKQQELTGKTAEQTVASVNRDITSDSASGGIAKNWDAQALKEEVQTQAQIMQTFGATAAKMIASYADSKQADALDKAKKAHDAGDEKAAIAYSAEAASWGENGAYRIALHVGAGALSGGAGGALGAAASAGTADLLNSLQSNVQHSLESLGVSPETAKLLAQGASGAVATGLGAAVGGTAGAATASNTDFNNRQLSTPQKELAKKLAIKSQGKYTTEQIEAQLRLMGDDSKGIPPNTLEVFANTANPATAKALYDSLIQDPSMPRVYQNMTAVEVPSNADLTLQQFIVANTRDGVGWIPGQSPYTPSTTTMPQTVSNTPPSLPTAPCANGDMNCAAGLQPNTTLEQRRAGAADLMNSVGTWSGRVGATATVAAEVPGVHQPAAAALGLGATVVNFGAGAMEQLMRPDMGQTLTEGGISVVTDRFSAKFPMLAPVINEVGEWAKSNPKAQEIKNEINGK